ncbi:MAG TPA: hypothetical protein VL498_06905 [Terracidiphilus sp.]|jgi:hypothetical protein|nr:hypothetical protein [Terracidiphilus sp.]
MANEMGDIKLALKPTAAPGWEVLELEAPIGDWTGARFIIRAPGAPGGLAVLMGGLGEDEERANAKLIATAGNYHEKVVLTLQAAMNALRSYQYGNSATDLAEEVAVACSKLLQDMEAFYGQI